MTTLKAAIAAIELLTTSSTDEQVIEALKLCAPFKAKRREKLLRAMVNQTGRDLEWLGATLATIHVFEIPISGGFIVPIGYFEAALESMNHRWCVVGHGGKTRFMCLAHDGTPEFFGKESFSLALENCFYAYEAGENKIGYAKFAPRWRAWTGRSAYSGYGFFPAPPGHPDACPEGCYNAYQGFAVEPKGGTWKLLLGHLYRNICQRDRLHFRWLIGWLAQLVQEPHVKPGTHVVLCGDEGTGKSKLGEWLVRLFGLSGMPITSSARLTGRFNAHLETLLFGLVEETFWAGDKQAEGALKALATAEELDYERKGMDPVCGPNYTRLMLASNESWVVPAASGGRRWFVLKVGNENKQDHAFFAALDHEMANGGLEAMLHDLLAHDYSAINVRKAPVTEWLVEQRLHSLDAKGRWWREVLIAGEFRFEDATPPIELHDTIATTVFKDQVFTSAKPHFGNERRKAQPSDVGVFLKKELEGLSGFGDAPRSRSAGGRQRAYTFPPLAQLRAHWSQKTGDELLALEESHLAAQEAVQGPSRFSEPNAHFVPTVEIKKSRLSSATMN